MEISIEYMFTQITALNMFYYAPMAQSKNQGHMALYMTNFLPFCVMFILINLNCIPDIMLYKRQTIRQTSLVKAVHNIFAMTFRKNVFIVHIYESSLYINLII